MMKTPSSTRLNFQISFIARPASSSSDAEFYSPHRNQVCGIFGNRGRAMSCVPKYSPSQSGKDGSGGTWTMLAPALRRLAFGTAHEILGAPLALVWLQAIPGGV